MSQGQAKGVRTGRLYWINWWYGRSLNAVYSLSFSDYRHGGLRSNGLLKCLIENNEQLATFQEFMCEDICATRLISQQDPKYDECIKVQNSQSDIMAEGKPSKVEERMIEKCRPVKVDVASWAQGSPRKVKERMIKKYRPVLFHSCFEIWYVMETINF